MLGVSDSVMRPLLPLAARHGQREDELFSWASSGSRGKCQMVALFGVTVASWSVMVQA